MTVLVVLTLLAGGLLAYGLLTQYTSTDPTQPTAKRVWASVVLGASAAGAALMQWIHGVTGP